MKKLLLGSTALVAGGLMAAPAMAADPIKIGVGGYYQFFGVAGNYEGSYAFDGTSQTYKGIAVYQEGEIHFIGQTKLDNGTTVGLTVELEGWNAGITSTTAAGSVRQIDEAFLFAFGDWGRIELGARDPVTYRMYYGAPSVSGTPMGFAQHNSGATAVNIVALANNKAAARIGTGTINGQWADANRINYATPRFMGFQIGLGYAPKISISAPTSGSGPANIASICGFNDATAAAICTSADNSYQDIFDVGVNYLGKFGDVSIALFGAYMTSQFVPSYSRTGSPATQVAASNMITGVNATGWQQWEVGAQFAFGGFTIGGAIGWDNNGLGANYYTGNDNDSRIYNAGIMYETGPWQLAFGWQGVYNSNGNGSPSLQSLATGTNVATAATGASTTLAWQQNRVTGGLSFGPETAQKFEVGASYALSPGIKLVGAGVAYNISGQSNATSAQSWAVFFGIDLRF